jgi:tetratricopeptide (TPR) repeat protein
MRQADSAFVQSQYDDVLDAYDEVVTRFGGATDPETQKAVITALAEKAEVLLYLDRNIEAVAAYEEVIRRSSPDANPEVAELIGQVRLARAGELGRGEESRAAYDEIILLYEDSTDPRLQIIVATAYVASANALLFDDPDASLPGYEEVLSRYGTSTDPDMLTWVVLAVNGKASVLERAGRLEELCSFQEDLFSLFEGTGNRVHEPEAARARFEKANTMRKLGRDEEAIDAYVELIDRYGDLADGGVPFWVSLAVDSVAGMLTRSDRVEEARAFYETHIFRYRNRTEPEFSEVTRFLEEQLGGLDSP